MDACNRGVEVVGRVGLSPFHSTSHWALTWLGLGRLGMAIKRPIVAHVVGARQQV